MGVVYGEEDKDSDGPWMLSGPQSLPQLPLPTQPGSPSLP